MAPRFKIGPRPEAILERISTHCQATRRRVDRRDSVGLLSLLDHVGAHAHRLLTTAHTTGSDDVLKDAQVTLREIARGSKFHDPLASASYQLRFKLGIIFQPLNSA